MTEPDGTGDWVRCPRCRESDYPGWLPSDVDEEACSATAVERLTEQHERILAQVDRLTKAVEAAASGVAG